VNETVGSPAAPFARFEERRAPSLFLDSLVAVVLVLGVLFPLGLIATYFVVASVVMRALLFVGALFAQ
jgi:hypothetical protein